MLEIVSHAWKYRGYAANSDALVFGNFTPVVDLWRRRWKDDGSLPSWSSFDFFDFKGYWGRISVGEIQSDPFDIYFRLWGTSLTEWWGVDYSNQCLGNSTIMPREWARAEREYFHAISNRGLIGLFSGPLDDYGRGHIRAQGIDLPLMENGRVTHILTAYLRQDQDTLCDPEIKPECTF